MKRFIVIIGLFIVFLGLVFFFRNHLIKISLEIYLGKLLPGQAKIEKVNSSLEGLSLDNLEITTEKYKVHISKATAQFRFTVFLQAGNLVLGLKEITLKLDQKEGFFVDGAFDGELSLGWDKFKLTSLDGRLKAVEPGKINIEKEVSLAFLKKYLDTVSYAALVDSFKNYQYNKGNIEIAKKAQVISIHLQFDSETAGKRNLIINYHLAGGE